MKKLPLPQQQEHLLRRWWRPVLSASRSCDLVFRFTLPTLLLLQEGFALDWSPTEEGRLATGDCGNLVYVTRTVEAGWATDPVPFVGHVASVEDLQWSPTETTVSTTMAPILAVVAFHKFKYMLAGFSGGQPFFCGFCCCFRGVDTQENVYGNTGVYFVQSSCVFALFFLWFYLSYSAADTDLLRSMLSRCMTQVFASGSADKTVAVWDLRKKNGAMLSLKAHEEDVNVISWNRNVTYLLASGSDDGSFKIWDLRAFGSGEPVAQFRWHKVRPPRSFALCVRWLGCCCWSDDSPKNSRRRIQAFCIGALFCLGSK